MCLTFDKKATDNFRKQRRPDDLMVGYKMMRAILNRTYDSWAEFAYGVGTITGWKTPFKHWCFNPESNRMVVDEVSVPLRDGASVHFGLHFYTHKDAVPNIGGSTDKLIRVYCRANQVVALGHHSNATATELMIDEPTRLMMLQLIGKSHFHLKDLDFTELYKDGNTNKNRRTR